MTVRAPRIPDPDHEPSNHGSFGQQARDRVTAGLIAIIAPLTRSPPGSPGGDLRVFRRPGPACGSDRRARPGRRARRTGRRAPDAGPRAGRGRPGRPGPPRRAPGPRVIVVGQPVDVRRLERRDLAERVAVELAELELVARARRRGRADRPAEVADAGSRSAGRSGRWRAAVRASHVRPRNGGWPRSDVGLAHRPPAVPTGRSAGSGAGTCRDVSTRPVTGRVGFGRGGPPRRRAASVVESRSVRRPRLPARARRAGRLAGQRRVGVVDLGHPRVATRDASGSSPVRSG